MIVEDQGSGIALIQQLKESGMPAIGWHSKMDKVARLSTVAPIFEAGQVYLPTEAPWLVDLLHELLGFPGAKYDDQIDSISQYLGWHRERSGVDRFEVDWGHDEIMPTVGSIADAILNRQILFRPGPRFGAP